MKNYAVGVLVGAISLTSLGSAQKLEEAKEKFALRSKGAVYTQEARKLFLEVASSTKDASQKVEAISYAARTLIYEGEAQNLMTGEGKENRRKLFSSCFKKVVPQISPAKLGYESPAYYYFTASCMGYYAQVSGTIENLGNIGKLNSVLAAGYAVENGDLFEGAGLKRVQAAVRSNPKAKPIPGGLYNPRVALELVNSAIDSSAYPGSVAGNMFCENFRRKIDVLIELADNENDANYLLEAKEVGEYVNEEFSLLLDVEEIPSRMVAETRHCMKKVKEKVKDL